MFEEMIQFPTGDMLNYYAELLIDMKQIDKAERLLEESIKLTESPMPLINLSLIMQSKGAKVKAEKYLLQAMEKDRECDAVYLQLGNFMMQNGDLQRALDYFSKAEQLCRTINELHHVISTRENAIAQNYAMSVIPNKFS